MVQAEKDQILASIESARVPIAVQVQKEWGHNKMTDSATPLSKTESKTRPTERAEIIKDIGNGVADIAFDTVQEQPPKIHATKRAFDMLILMFSVTAEEAAKSVQWDAFVHAMLDMGFSARSGGGSAVVFENGSLAEGKANGGKIVSTSTLFCPVGTLGPP